MRGVTLLGPLPPPSGGIATHVFDLRRMLGRRRVPCRVVVPRREPSFFAEAAWRSLRDLVHVHVHGHSQKAWWLAGMASLAPRTLLTVHSGLMPAFVGRHPELVRAACARYEAIICVAPALASALEGARVEARRLHVAPAFVAEALGDRAVPAGVRTLRARHSLLVAAASAPEPEYGLGLLLEAFTHVRARIPDAALVLFGRDLRGPALARPGVYLLGDLDRAEALGLLATADLFVRPTLADGDATSVREALALGGRVVASDAALRPQGVHLHRSGDTEDLSRAIVEAARAPARRACPSSAEPTLLALYRQLALEMSCAESLAV